MIFAHDTEVALAAAAALANTVRGEGDTLATMDQLDTFVRTWQWSGIRSGKPAELAAVRALRPTISLLWNSEEDAAVVVVNELLREAHALPQLIKHDGWDYHVHATSLDASLAERMAVEAAMALTDVIRMKELERLHMCAGENCSDLFVDLSKNRSRRFCSAACSNRVNVAAYRARRR
jgi:predicted RNA-binding Zn ribbon-like protein